MNIILKNIWTSWTAEIYGDLTIDSVRLGIAHYSKVKPQVLTEYQNALNDLRKAFLWCYQEAGSFDFICVFFGNLDDAGHYMFYDQQSYKEIYYIVDRFIADIIKKCQPENVILASDHGMCDIETFKKTPLGEKLNYDKLGKSFKLKEYPNILFWRGALKSIILSGEHSDEAIAILDGKDLNDFDLTKSKTMIDIYKIILKVMQ